MRTKRLVVCLLLALGCGKSDGGLAPPADGAQFSADAGSPLTGGTFVTTTGTTYLIDGIQIGIVPAAPSGDAAKIGIAFRGQRADGAAIVIAGQLKEESLFAGDANLSLIPVSSVLQNGSAQAWLVDSAGTVIASAKAGNMTFRLVGNLGDGTSAADDAQFRGTVHGHVNLSCSYRSESSTTTYDSGLVVTGPGTVLSDPNFGSAFCARFRPLLHQ